MQSSASVCEVAEPPMPAGQSDSERLLGYLDSLFQKLIFSRRPSDELAADCSRDDIRTLTLLGSSGALRMSSFADALDMPLSTATNTIDRLLSKGLVVRSRSEEDRRQVQVGISERGRQLRASVRKRYLEMAQSWLAPLSPGEREVYLDLMAKITDAAVPAGNTNGTPSDQISEE